MRTVRSERIEDRIRSVMRADYDDIVNPDLPERQLPPQVVFFRIAELARFWDDPQTGGESLSERQRRLITGLYGIRRSWTYVILGDGGVASVFMGLSCRDGESRSLEQGLSAQLPGSSWRMDRTPQEVLAELVTFPMVAGVSGNPSMKRTDDRQLQQSHDLPGLESLFDTMADKRWAYMVLARPLADRDVADDLQRTEAELLAINSAYRRRGGAEENNNPMATRYAALLESAHQKLLQGQSQGMWDVQSYLMTDTAADCERGAQALHAAFGGPGSEPQPLRIKAGGRNGMRGLGTRMTTRLNTSEVTVLAGLPRREVAGLQVTDHVAFGMTSGPSSEDGIALGSIMSGGTSTPLWFGIALEGLCKHMFVAGVPGSGKTRTCLYLLSQLWREHRIPWLVLEPSMKSEYRALLRSAIGPDLAVFTAGDETVSPLRMNPLEVPDGVQVQTHIGELASLFKAAFAMEAPIPYVLDEAIHRVYEEHGWDIVTGDHPTRGDDCQPTLDDLLQTCERVVNELGHDERVKANVRGALRTRLTSLMRGAKGRMLNVRRSIATSDLLSKPTVIEFSAIGDDEEKSFLLGCLLLKLVQHRRTQGLSQDGLRHVTLIEEAHRLLRNVPETVGTSVANPRRQAIETFCHMLSEIRAYGEGIVVVEQMPSKLVPDAIRNSGIKVVHRLTAEEERKIVGGAMSLNDAQTRFLSALQPGEAVGYADGSVNACRVCIPDHAGREGYLRTPPSNAEIKVHMQGRIQPFEAAGVSTIPAKCTVADGDTPCRQMHSCPDSSCATRDAFIEYVRRHEGDIRDSFRQAMEEGFDALWHLGSGIARAVWQETGPEWKGSFCAVMAVAGHVGMGESDLRVLRRNMWRLREHYKQGGVS